MWRPGRDRSAAAAGEEDREVVVRRGALPSPRPRAVDDHAVVEQGAVAFLDRLQLVEEVGELLRVERR